MGATFPPDQRVILDADKVAWREVGDEVVVLVVSTSTYLALNGTAGVLWRRLDTGATPVELAAELVAVYGVDEAIAAADVEAFLAALQDRELLVQAP